MSAPATDHVWRLATQSAWSAPWLGLGVALALVAIGLGVWSARRERRRWRRVVLGALRFCSVATALVLFLQPAIEFEDVTRVPNHVAILVDASQSMSLAERKGDPTRAERAAKLLRESSTLLTRWRGEHAIDFYRFGGELEPATEASLAALTPAQAKASSTHLREALTELRKRYDGDDLGGVVVISDGIDNGRWASGLDAGERDVVKGLATPVSTAWTGRAGLRDVAIPRVLSDGFAFARNVVKVEAVVRTVGAREAGWIGKKIVISLKQIVPATGTSEVARATITLDGKSPEQRVAFEFTPERVGKFVYEISTPVLDGEAIADNNARAFLLKVIRDKVRVLLVAGRPSWDERFLRGLLKRDPNVDLISFFILRTPSDAEVGGPEELSLIPFPTEELFDEQLPSFDLVFLDNFNFAPYGVERYLPKIREYVEGGGALAMVGGDLSFSSGGYYGSPIADVLPVELLPDAQGEQLVTTDPFRMQLTAEGRGHPITALRPGSVENRKRWESLAPLDGQNLVARARPGATVLGVHPTLRAADGRPMPVLAVSDVGKGRSLAFLSDGSWRWGFGAALDDLDATAGGGARAYQTFWENAIRWLIKDPELRLVRVETDAPEYTAGEPVHIKVRVREPDYRPAVKTSVSLTIARAGFANPEPIALRTDDNGEAIFDAATLPPGGYRVTARRSSGGAPPAMNSDDEVFLVRAAGKELDDPEARDALLRDVASASGGEYRAPGQSLEGVPMKPPRVVRVNRYRDLELWSTWMSLLAAALLLSAEWGLRRRWGLA